MRRTEPPSAATWILHHFKLGRCNDALAGDLMEEFRSGRSVGWYWRQVLAATAIGFLKEIVDHQFVFAFAVLWSMLAPAWLLIISGIAQHFNLSARIWQLDWPWSTLSYMALLLLANLIFIWTGIALYLVAHLSMTENLRVALLSRGILASIPVLFALSALLIALPAQFLQRGHPVNRLSAIRLSPGAVTDLGPIVIQPVAPQEKWDLRFGDTVIDPYANPRFATADWSSAAMIVRLPFFLCVLCALWRTTSLAGRRRNRVAA
jgi:hypothetical protein